MTAPRWAGRRSQLTTAIVIARDGGVCHWCGGVADSADHWPVPFRDLIRLGGDPFDPATCVAACLPCNQDRGATFGPPPTRAPPRPRPSRDW